MKFDRTKIASNRKNTISSLKNGKRWAFKAIFNEYHEKLYFFAKKMGLKHEDAEGVVQDVFIEIWEKKDRIDIDLSFNAYMYTITKRLTIKKLKRFILENDYRASLKNPTGKRSSSEEYVIFSNLLDHANNSIDKLPPDRKQIFMLSKQHGLSNAEIADKLNLSKRTVENQLYRATKTIREEIS